jgi:mevalonate kinase
MILIGEYSVLEGGKSIVMAVDRYCNIKIKLSKSQDNILHSPTLNINDLHFRINSKKTIEFKTELTPILREKLVFFIRTMEQFLREVQTEEKLPLLEISIDTRQFFNLQAKGKLGLGSSAALSTGLVHGLLFAWRESQKNPYSQRELFDLSHKIHYLSQENKGSGIDIAASCFGGVISFQKQNLTTIKKLKMPKELLILPVWSGVSESTRDLVEKVSSFKAQNPSDYRTIMKKLKLLSEEAIDFIIGENIPAFLNKCREFFLSLNDLGAASKANIISQPHQEIADIAASHGAVYKPSGAGGGDIGLIMTNSKEIADALSDYILRSKFQLLNLRIAKNGSYIESI